MSKVERNSDILGGVPVFQGTRVLIRTLFDYLMRQGPQNPRKLSAVFISNNC
ncbi:DUF433 domain-containing protein [Verrucomicrobia bacterium]|nr:DUF433 domain-containing protein [Verrucomicrobiota bacterium]